MAVKRVKNTVKALFEEFSFAILGREKAGKTSLYYETMMMKYGSTDAGAIIPFEVGYKHLNQANILTCEDDNGNPKPMVDRWEDFVEIVDALVEDRQTDWADVRCVLIDTADRFYALAEDYTLRMSKKKTGKPALTINDAFSGFGRGKKFMLGEVYGQLQRLRGAGYGIWYALHTKFKNVKKDGDNEGYDKIGSLMTEDLYKNLAQDCDFICMISDEKNIQNGKLLGTSRKIRFTSDGFYDCGSRFSKYLPEAIEYDTFGFLDAFDEAIMKAGNFTREELEKQRVVQQKEKEKAIETFIKEDGVAKVIKEKEDLVESFNEIIPLLNDTVRKALVKKYSELEVSTAKDLVDKIGVEEARDIYNKINSTVHRG